MASSLPQKRSIYHLNQHQSHTDIIGDEPKSKKQKQSICSKLFRNNLDHSQFVNIFQAIDNTKIFKSQLIIQTIAEFSNGKFEPCANEHCIQTIPILHETEKNHKANKFGYGHSLKPHQLLCSQCISFLLNLKKVWLTYDPSTFEKLSQYGIFSVSDLNKYKRKKYLLFHQAKMSPNEIDRLFEIEKCDSTLDEMRNSNYRCESAQCSFHNSEEEPIRDSECLDKQFINKNDIAMTIWDIPGFNLGQLLEENYSVFGGNEHKILVCLKGKIPEIQKQISPQKLDLQNYFSERHGSLLAEVSRSGNLESVKYFIEEHKLNPHFVYPRNVNIMSFVTPYHCRGEDFDHESPEVFRYFAGLGCNMELTSVNGDTIAWFVANDDVSSPPYINTKMLLSFGFCLDDIAGKGTVTIGDRCGLSFEEIELLKPQSTMNETVFKNIKGLVRKIVTNMYRSYTIDNIFKNIFAYLNVRDCCNVYQYTVNKNKWDKIMNSGFLQ